jgi:hypothetical protein
MPALTLPSRRARVVVIAVAALIALVGLAIILGGPQLMRASIRSDMEKPAVLDDATVVVGDPASFFLSNSAFVQLHVSPAVISELLSSRVVLSDCGKAGRQCSAPVWSAGSMYFDGNSSNHVPRTAMCA